MSRGKEEDRKGERQRGEETEKQGHQNAPPRFKCHVLYDAVKCKYVVLWLVVVYAASVSIRLAPLADSRESDDER